MIDLYCNINSDDKGGDVKNIREQTIVIPVRSLTYIETEKISSSFLFDHNLTIAK